MKVCAVDLEDDADDLLDIVVGLDFFEFESSEVSGVLLH